MIKKTWNLDVFYHWFKERNGRLFVLLYDGKIASYSNATKLPERVVFSIEGRDFQRVKNEVFELE
jgi:hypothetical protein